MNISSSPSSSTNMAGSKKASESESPKPTQHAPTHTGTVPAQDEQSEEVIVVGNEILVAMRTLGNSSLGDLPPLSSPRMRQDSRLQTSNVSLEDFGEDLCEWWQNEPTDRRRASWCSC